MTLHVDDAELVRACRHVHAAFVAFGQYRQPCRLELLPGNIVKARMRDVEARIDVPQQRVADRRDAVAVDTPSLARQWLPVDAMKMFEQRMRCQAGAQRRRHVVPRPFDHLDERLPERFFLQPRIGNICARDDERIETGIAQRVEVAVIALDIAARLLAALQGLQGKRVHEELGDPVTAADEADELALRRPQRRIRHHVQKTDVQLADVLVHGTVQRQDFVSLFAQLAECRQPGVSDEWHVVECNVLYGVR